jgi:hypothetical protein
MLAGGLDAATSARRSMPSIRGRSTGPLDRERARIEDHAAVRAWVTTAR